MANVKFVAPRVPLVDLRTGQITREWYLFLASLFDGNSNTGTLPDPTDEIASLPLPVVDDVANRLALEIVDRPAQSPAPALTALEFATALLGPQQDAGARVDALEQITALLGIADQDRHARLDDIEAMLATLGPVQQGIFLGSGLYTPTITNVANVSASSALQCQYLRIGDVVTVSGQVSITPTAAATSTTARLSLPYASNFGSSNQCAGVMTPYGFGSGVGAISADAASDTADITFAAPNTFALGCFFTFTYRVI